jgi:hypothetical protein
MKWPTMILIMFVLVLGVTTLVFFKDDIFAKDVVLSEDEQKGMRLLQAAQDACLSGESDSVDLYAKVQGSLNEGANAGAGISDVTTKGAVNYLDESIRQIADEGIRACLAPHMNDIKACILGDCQAGMLPKTIDFRFTSPEPDQINAQNLYSDFAFFRMKNKMGEKKLVKQDDDFFVETIGLLEPGVTSIAQVAFEVRQGNTLARQPAKICLQRADSVSANTSNYVEFRCNTNGECTHDEMSPKWFDLCALASVDHNDAYQENWLSHFISSAYAQTSSTYWAVPSLQTLESRMGQQDLQGSGYTHFSIDSDQALKNGADAFYYDLKVNGQTVLEDGLYPDFNLKPYVDSEPFSVDIALQNLNFTGLVNGCDELSLNLQFMKNSQPLGESIQWQRSYVSLRDARNKQMQLGDATLSWQGQYKRAAQEYDTELFISSLEVADDLNFADNLREIKRIQQAISDMKDDFDRAGITFNGKSLVAVIRPPLRRISYGLVVGMVEDTGQIRYTFASSVVRELKAFLLELREQGQHYRRIIRDDIFPYSLRGAKSYSQSPPVCWDELVV